jgi:hypothetical protein
MSRNICGAANNTFLVLHKKDLTPQEEENLQLNNQAINIIYEALDPKSLNQSKI